MPTLTNDQKILLRAPGHRSEYFLSILRPRIMWSMRVNDATIDDSETTIVMDGGSGETGFADTWLDSTFGVPGMEIWVGTVPGDNNVGVVRLRSYTTPDAGVTATMVVSRNNLAWADNQYVSFIYNWPVKPMFPLILGDGTFTKEGDITYTDQNTELGPVVIAGTWRAAFTYATLPFGTTFDLDMSGSYTTAPGATIVRYDADVIGCGGVCGGIFNSATPTGSIMLTEGAWWVRFRVEDSNGNAQLSYRLFFVHSPDPISANYPIRDFEVTGLDGDYDAGGWKAKISIRSATVLPFMKNAPIVVWENAYYGSTNESVTVLPDEFDDERDVGISLPNTSIFCGYLRNFSISQDRATGIGVVTYEATTLDGLMRQHYQYSVSLETVPTTPDKWYEFPSYMDPGLAVYHFLRWHTRVLESVDVIGLRTNTDGIAYTEMEDGTFYSMPDDYERNKSIRYHLVCDKGGRLHSIPEVQLLTDAERAALPIVAAIEKRDTSGEIEIRGRPENTVAQVHLYGFAFNGTFLPDGKPDATPLCALAPGVVPDDDGPSIAQINYQTLRDQTHCNQIAGRYYAHYNNHYPEVSLNLGGNYLGVLDVAYAEWWTMSLAANDTIYGLEWTDKKMVCRKVSASLSHASGITNVSAVFEPEADGPEGVPTNCPEVPEVPDGGIPEIPPPSALGGAIMTGASAHYLPLLAQNWDLRTADPVNDLGADPWWRAKQGSVASANAIVWRCGPGNIYRSDDAGVTWVDKTPASVPLCAGVTPAIANIEFIRYDGSFITEDQHAFLGIYDNSGVYVSWLFLTSDDGDTWDALCLNGEGIPPGPGASENSAYEAPGSSSVPYAKDHCVALTATSFMTIWRGTAGGDIDNMYAQVSVVNSDNSLTPGLVYEFTDDPAVGIWAACRLSDTRVMIIYYSYTNGKYQSVMADVAGTVITYDFINDILEDNDITGLVTLESTLTAIALLTTNSIMMALAPRDADGVTGLWCTMLTVSGNTVTPGAWADVDSTEEIDHVRLARINNSSAAIVYTRTNGGAIFSPSADRTGHSVVATAGAPVTFGGITTIYSDDINLYNYAPDVCVVDEINAVCLYNADITAGVLDNVDLHVVVGSIGSDITWGTFVTVHTAGVACPTIEAIPGSRVAVCYPVTNNTTIKTYEIGGGTATLEDTYTENGTGDNISVNQMRSTNRIALQGFNKFLVVGVPGAGGSEDDLRAIDLRFGRGAGAVIYVTCVDATNVRSKLLVCDMSPAVLTRYDMGDEAVGDLGVETFFGDDDSLMLYGRFVHDTLGSVHILHSDDGGATFTAIVDTWGSDRCSALRISSGGYIRAIRSDSSSAKIYTFTMGNVPTYRSTLPFPAGVRLRALAVSTRGVAFAAANVAQAMMVVSSKSPFSLWTDITYDHATDEEVNSVVVL